MTIDPTHARLALVCAVLLSLGACGQTGALVLPGAVPAQQTQDGAPSEAEEQEEDESDQ